MEKLRDREVKAARRDGGRRDRPRAGARAGRRAARRCASERAGSRTAGSSWPSSCVDGSTHRIWTRGQPDRATRSPPHGRSRSSGGRGAATVRRGAATCIVVVDVLSFSTSVTIAVERGALSGRTPGRERARARPRHRRRCWPATGARTKARRCRRPACSTSTKAAGWCCPRPTGRRSPSPRSGRRRTAGACVAPVPAQRDGGGRVPARLRARSVCVPAGERWGDGSLRPAYEDLVGAGALSTGCGRGCRRRARRRRPRSAALAFRALRPLASSARPAASSSSGGSPRTSGSPRSRRRPTWSPAADGGPLVPA